MQAVSPRGEAAIRIVIGERLRFGVPVSALEGYPRRFEEPIFAILIS
jgi:hypothetical protein